MIVPDPSTVFSRAVDSVSLPSCQPFTLQSSLCVGDFVAILVGSISGVGFFFWSIHAIHKMRHEFPFTYKPEDEDREIAERARADPFQLPSNYNNALDNWRGGRRTLTSAERARTRMLLTYPEEEFYQHELRDRLAAIPNEADDAPGRIILPRTPPRAAGQTQRGSRRSSRRGSVSRNDPNYATNVNHANDAKSLHVDESPVGAFNDGYGRHGSPPSRAGTHQDACEQMRGARSSRVGAELTNGGYTYDQPARQANVNAGVAYPPRAWKNV